MKRQTPRLVFVTDAVAPFHFGGKEVRTREITSRLSRCYDVKVYTMNWWRGGRSFVKDGVQYRALCSYRPLYVSGRRSIVQAVAFSLACLRLLFVRFDAIEADHMPIFPVLALRLVASVRRKRLVVTWHEVWGRAYWQEYLGKVGIVAWWVERIAMRLPDNIIAASQETANRLSAYCHPRTSIAVAPNGIDFEAIDAVAPYGQVTDVCFVGRLIEHKGVRTLLQALALLRDRGEATSCRIVGTGPDWDDLHQLRQQLNLESLVEFTGAVSESRDVYAFLKASRVFVLPSTREGFGIALLEAIACGLPVITADHPENLSRNLALAYSEGHVCPPDEACFAQTIGDVLRRVRATAGAAVDASARPDWLANYDWDRVAALYLDVMTDGRVSHAAQP